jgi:hypothetical protein
MILKMSDLQTNLFLDGNSEEAVKQHVQSGRTGRVAMRDLLSSLFAAFLVSGCAAGYSPAPLPANHPANPAASEAPPPPPSQAFRAENLQADLAEEALVQAPHAGQSMGHGGH